MIPVSVTVIVSSLLSISSDTTKQGIQGLNLIMMVLARSPMICRVTRCIWTLPIPADTFDEQVAGGANGSRLVGGGTGEAAAVFSERLADHHPGKSVLVAYLEVD